MTGQNQCGRVRSRRGRGEELKWCSLWCQIGAVAWRCKLEGLNTGVDTHCGRYSKGLLTFLFLPEGAWVQVSPSPELREGQAVVLKCRVPVGIPEETSYQWYWNGQPLQDSTSATLHFAAITLSQAGAYHCQSQAPGSATLNLAAPVSLHISCKHFPLTQVWGGQRVPSA